MDKLILNEHRCSCGKLLLKGVFFDGALEIKCRKCGTINSIGTIKSTDDATHYLLIVNDRGQIVNASDSAGRILGYPREELIGKNFTEINTTMPKEIGKKFFGSDSVLNEENFFKLNTIHQTKDNKKLPVTVFLKLHQTTKNEKWGLVSTELKTVDHNSHEHNRAALEFVENACDYYFDLDRVGAIEYISPSFEKIFGFTQEMIVGKNYFDILPITTRAEAVARFNHFLARQQPFRISHDVGLNANHRQTHSELYFTPKFGDLGKFTGYRVLGWEIKNSAK